MGKDEDLRYIANKFNTSIEAIQNLNDLYYLDDVKEGRNLVVPDNSKDYFNYYIVKKGDTLYQIGREYNINPKLLASLNGLNMNDYIYPNQEILIPKRGYSYYITAEGDTIDSLLKIFNTNLNKFMEENKTIYLMKDQLLVNKK